MSNPARALSDVLAPFIGEQQSPERFLAAVARHVGLEGDGAEAQALAYLNRLFYDCYALIERMPGDENDKAHLRSLLGPVDGLRSLNVANMSFQQMWNPLLAPTTPGNLHSLDLAFRGVYKLNVNQTILEQAKTELRKSGKQIRASAIPENLKSAILKRILQINEAVEHFEVFGQVEIQQRVDALIGTLAREEANVPEEVKGVFRKLKDNALAILTGFVVAGDAAGYAWQLADYTPKAYLEYFGPLDSDTAEAVTEEGTGATTDSEGTTD